MIRQLYNKFHKKIYYSTYFHRLIAPRVNHKKIEYPRFSFYGKKLLSNLLQTKDVRIIDDSPGKLLLQLGKIKAEITSLEELYILNEIFIDGCYNFLTPGDNIVVIDIGMNVGFASLFFSQSDAVKRIYSFEPFEPTFRQGLKNFELNNPGIKSKIIPHNYGLAAIRKEEEWDYDYLRKGDTGIRNSFETDAAKFNIAGKEKIKVVLEDVSEALSSIFSSRTSEKIVIKIDCEGAEYEILEKLSVKGMLEKADVLMIEWHLKGPEVITSLLLKHNFSILSLLPYNKVAGMIYAFNRKN